MTNATTTTKNQFRTILQNVICYRYSDRDAALAAIETAFQAGAIDEHQRRQLSAAAREV